MAASIFKRRSTAAATDLKKLTETETAQAQSSFNIEKITEIQNCFTRGEILLVPGRIFIREGILWKVCRRGPKKRQFFLFNDVLIYGSVISRGYYSNQHILPISSMTVSSKCHYMPQVELETSKEHNNSEELDPENAFQINHADKSFHVFALTKADKVNWIANLTKQINKLNRGEESTATVYKAVWVPDSVSKQCMICSQKFSAFVRKHHCRMCGRLVCSQCSPGKGDISQLSGGSSSGKVERVCKQCNKPLIVTKTSEAVNSSSAGGENMPSDPHKIIPITRPETQQQEEDGDSTETEDSDDSENEKEEEPPLPVPPPRKKKQQKEDASTPPTMKTKQPPPPRPAPPKLSSPSIKKIPPGRPTSFPGRPTSPPPGRPTSPPQKTEGKDEPDNLEAPLTSSSSGSGSIKRKIIDDGHPNSSEVTSDHTHKEDETPPTERPKPVPRQQVTVKQSKEEEQEEPSPRPVVAKRTKFSTPPSSQTSSPPPLHNTVAPPTDSTNDTSLENPPIEVQEPLATEVVLEATPTTEPLSLVEDKKIKVEEIEEDKEKDEQQEKNDKEKEKIEDKTEEHLSISNGEPVVTTHKEHSQLIETPSSGGRSPSMNARPRRSKFAASAPTVDNSS